ncbi:MAG TPA: ABC transporter permease [Polyangiaceae bacterium]
MLRFVVSDLRFALRLARRSPAFYALVIALVASGVGATTAVFSIVHSALLRPLPYKDADALTMVRSTATWAPGANGFRATLQDFLDWRAQATTFDGMAAIKGDSFGVASGGTEPERVTGARVSGDFFRLLGVRALHGRLLAPEDDRAGAPCVVVVSTAFWRRRFSADPSVVGRAILLNAIQCSVVGVAPEGFAFGDFGGYDRSGAFYRSDVWVPLAATLSDYARMSNPDRSIEGMFHFLNVLGRRKPGISQERAQIELSAIGRRLAAQHPRTNANKSVLLVPLQEFLVGASRTSAWLLFTSVALVFLIVCANVANLMLARARARHPEMAARIALGATRPRLVAQILTETTLVFLVAAVAGGVLARSLVDVFAEAGVERRIASIVDMRLDLVAFGVASAACLVVGLLFAVAPALATAHVEPQTVLRESATRTGTSRSQRRMQSVLVVTQVALALALLAGSGLALKALEKLAATPLGFDAENLATATVVVPEAKYPGGGPTDWPPVESVVEFYRKALERVAALPGVKAVTADICLPIDCGGTVWVEGGSLVLGDGKRLGTHAVTLGYFETMKIPLLRGRDFTAADRRDARWVAIISQAAAEQLFPGVDPIGRRIDSGHDEYPVWREIVGIVGNVRTSGLGAPASADGYFPLEQMGAWNREMTIFARSDRPDAVLREIPRSIQAIDPHQDVAELALMSERVSDSIRHQRHLALLLGAFAVFALLLSALGLFGLVSYATAQRTRELGIRMALGSTPERVVGLVLAGGFRLLGMGLAAGLALAVVVGRVLAERIPHVSAFDPGVFAAVSALLVLVGILGCVIPAWRAAQIAPARALRYE